MFEPLTRSAWLKWKPNPANESVRRPAWSHAPAHLYACPRGYYLEVINRGTPIVDQSNILQSPPASHLNLQWGSEFTRPTDYNSPSLTHRPSGLWSLQASLAFSLPPLVTSALLLSLLCIFSPYASIPPTVSLHFGKPEGH